MHGCQDVCVGFDVQRSSCARANENCKLLHIQLRVPEACLSRHLDNRSRCGGGWMAVPTCSAPWSRTLCNCAGCGC